MVKVFLSVADVARVSLKSHVLRKLKYSGLLQMKEQEWLCLARKRWRKPDSSTKQVDQRTQEWSEEILLLLFTIIIPSFLLRN